MTVETGDYIENLDPSAPANTQPVGEVNEHVQLIKRVLDTTFQGSVGDLYDVTAGAVLVGPIQTNRQPADIAAIALEIGLDLDATGDPTRIDGIDINALRRDQPETIDQIWIFNAGAMVAFNDAVEFFAATDWTGVVPQIDGVDVATVDDIPGDVERSKIDTVNITASTYTTISGDRGKKINYHGTGAHALTIGGGGNDDTFLITNANATGDTTVMTVDHSLGELFQLRDGTTSASFTITGRFKTVGIHRVQGLWQVTGDYD